MPLKKASVNKQRVTLIRERTKARNTNYEMIKTVKRHNQNNEPINFRKLCELTDFHIVAQFIKEAESWGMIESRYGEIDGRWGCMLLTVALVGDAFIKYCEQKKMNP
jgi:hypothetical protein